MQWFPCKPVRKQENIQDANLSDGLYGDVKEADNLPQVQKQDDLFSHLEEDEASEDGVAVYDCGPIDEWWMAGFNGGKKIPDWIIDSSCRLLPHGAQ